MADSLAEITERSPRGHTRNLTSAAHHQRNSLASRGSQEAKAQLIALSLCDLPEDEIEMSFAILEHFLLLNKAIPAMNSLGYEKEVPVTFCNSHGPFRGYWDKLRLLAILWKVLSLPTAFSEGRYTECWMTSYCWGTAYSTVLSDIHNPSTSCSPSEKEVFSKAF
ncbi:hypothetical protein DL771_011923 [Monosporascus sp. 5C6A]|nr:hypothetical protein DL771_011923 [Monosporascus sp. 5C6A]